MRADGEHPPFKEETPSQLFEHFEPSARTSVEPLATQQGLTNTDANITAPMPDSASPDVRSSEKTTRPVAAQPDIDIKASGHDVVTHEASASDEGVASGRDVNVTASGGGIAAGIIHGDVYNAAALSADMAEARDLFMSSLRHRDQFVGSFLKQALQQATMTFRLSIFFTTMGGLVVLCAAVLAVTRFAGSPSHGIALVSGIAGILIGTSGAAFSLRADKARKHLAAQASKMHSQLLDERRFTQVIDLLAGIRDPQLNDQARVSLAMRLMGEAVTDKELDPSTSKPRQRYQRQRK